MVSTTTSRGMLCPRVSTTIKWTLHDTAMCGVVMYVILLLQLRYHKLPRQHGLVRSMWKMI